MADVINPLAVTFQPTPTQGENDLAAAGTPPAVKQYDGSPIDQSSKNPALPAPPGAPTIGSIAPSTGAIASAPFTLAITGTNFTAGARAYFNNNPVPTTYTNATHIGCSGVTAPAPGVFPLEVHDVGGFSNTVNFTITATMLLEQQETQPAASARRGAQHKE